MTGSANDTALSDHLRGLESQLLRGDIRKDSQKMKALLSEEFREFGQSGKTYDRDGVIALCAGECTEGRSFDLADFRADLISPDTALATYRVTVTMKGQSRQSLRSSVWRKHGQSWRLLFHQGTPIPVLADGPTGDACPC